MLVIGSKELKHILGRIVSALALEKGVKSIVIWSDAVTFDLDDPITAERLNNAIAGSGLCIIRNQDRSSGGAYRLWIQGLDSTEIDGQAIQHYWIPRSFWDGSLHYGKRQFRSNLDTVDDVAKAYKPWPMAVYRPRKELLERQSLEALGDMLGRF